MKNYLMITEKNGKKQLVNFEALGKEHAQLFVQYYCVKNNNLDSVSCFQVEDSFAVDMEAIKAERDSFKIANTEEASYVE